MKVRAWALIILIIGVLAGFYDSAQFLIRQPADGNSHWLKPFQLGLDLQGGTHLVYQADTASIASSDVAEAIAGVRDIIERRVNLFGVAEPVVQTENVGSERRLIVELAGVFDIKEAIKTIGETPFLEFKELKRDKSGGVASSTGAVTDFVATNLTGRYLKKASLNFAQNLGEPEISLEFNDDGAKIFEEITGKFSVDEARQLVRRFNAGALPVPIVLISQQSIGSSLGKDALFKSLRAALYGTIAVMLFMIFWYRLPGLIAVLALGVYSALTLLLFKLVPVTLSSAGIAGFILSVGMAVDANILIFERMKQEIRSGKFLDSAMA